MTNRLITCVPPSPSGPQKDLAVVPPDMPGARSLSRTVLTSQYSNADNFASVLPTWKAGTPASDPRGTLYFGCKRTTTAPRSSCWPGFTNTSRTDPPCGARAATLTVPVNAVRT